MKPDLKIKNSDFKYFEINPEKYSREYVMLLAQDYHKNPNKEIPKADYKMLDNGAAEGEQLSNKDLIEVIKLVKPDEIIYPDIMGDKDATIKSSTEFYNELPDDLKNSLSKLGVIHGKTFKEFQECAEYYMESGKIKVDVIGVPKYSVYSLKNMFVRVKLAKWLNEKYPNVKIHFLGMNEPFYIIKQAIEKGMIIRSIDSIVPYQWEKENSSIPFDYYLRDPDISYNELK